MAAIRTENRTEGPTHRLDHGLSPTDRRDLIPELGLREYWYPGIPAARVGKRKATLVQILGDDVTFFQGKEGVVAITNSCPHRGAMLHMGDCWWKGTISCSYHGWTFDETGDVTAVLGEGPDSKIHGKVQAKIYPTRTLKGVVFVWMGNGAPAPIEEDVPEEFFRDDLTVLHTNEKWNTNWRPALENVYDAHVQYVHRDSFQLMGFPIPQAGPSRTKPEVINGRALNMDFASRRMMVASMKDRVYQEYYPKADVVWPRGKWRLYWTWMFKWAANRRMKKAHFIENPEWKGGHHLPSMFRAFYGTHLYTRWAVPVDKDNIRLFYFHAAKPGNLLGRIYEKLNYHLWHDWNMNFNFSGQDGRQMIHQYYDRPEKLSATDVQTIEWRKLVLQHGRGMQEQDLTNLSDAEVFAEELDEEMKAEASAG